MERQSQLPRAAPRLEGEEMLREGTREHQPSHCFRLHWLSTIKGAEGPSQLPPSVCAQEGRGSTLPGLLPDSEVRG